MKEIVNLINKHFKPISIFLYGSRARGDFVEGSDYELGVLFPRKSYVRRSKIKEVVDKKGFSIFPFEYESFLLGDIDTPFQKNIYLHELVLSGRTLSGKRVIENMDAPQIRTIDLIQDLRFNIGYSLASVISHKNKDRRTASAEFHKSCIFGTRDLEILQLRVFPGGFDNISDLSKRLNLGKYSSLVEKAFSARVDKREYEECDIFENISYLNKFIEPVLLDFFEKYGNAVLIG